MKAVRNAVFKHGKYTDWVKWAGRHPGYFLLGALVMALVSLQQSPNAQDVEINSSADAVPLFI